MEIVPEDRGAEHHLPAGVVGCGDGVVCREGTVRRVCCLILILYIYIYI